MRKYINTTAYLVYLKFTKECCSLYPCTIKIGLNKNIDTRRNIFSQIINKLFRSNDVSTKRVFVQNNTYME